MQYNMTFATYIGSPCPHREIAWNNIQTTGGSDLAFCWKAQLQWEAAEQGGGEHRSIGVEVDMQWYTWMYMAHARDG